jgi:SAM-dependent methyltransferase
MTMIAHWRQQVAAYQAQLQRVQQALGDSAADVWEALTPAFRADPRRTDDPEINRLLQEVNPTTTVLDVGGGAGRFALPLALRCQHVTVVEPAASMRNSMQQLATETGITNVTLVASTWEAAVVEPVDIVLSAHVIYTITDIEPFVRKLVQHARHKVIMPTHMRPPMSRFDPFWPWVYGEEKQSPPGAAACMQVLWEMDIYPQLEMFAPVPARAFRNRERALETLRQRLFVAPDTPEDRRLQEAMQMLLVETPEGLVIKDSKPGRLALIAWSVQPDA